MSSNIILEGIKDATKTINSKPFYLIDHATDQLCYLDEIIKKMGCGCVALVNETYSNILMLEFETILLTKAIKLNHSEIILNDCYLEIIKSNCDDLLEKIKIIREMQENIISELGQQDIHRIFNNDPDINLGVF